MLAQPRPAARLAGVPVLLRLGAVELDHLLVLLREVVAVLLQLLADRPAQRPTVLLDRLHGGPAWLLGGSARRRVRGQVRLHGHGSSLADASWGEVTNHH